MRQENQASQSYLLLDFLQRLERNREGRRAVHIHLSELAPQNRREHHIRMAINTFEEQVKQYEGRIFTIENADIVFVWRDAPLEELGEPVLRLRYLFTDDPLLQAVDDTGHDKFSTWYELEEQFPEFQAVVEVLYAEDQNRVKRRAQSAGQSTDEPEVRTPLKPEVLGKLEGFLSGADLSNVMRLQAICVVAGDQHRSQCSTSHLFPSASWRVRLCPMSTSVRTVGCFNTSPKRWTGACCGCCPGQTIRLYSPPLA